jgi:hypothetical protein
MHIKLTSLGAALKKRSSCKSGHFPKPTPIHNWHVARVKFNHKHAGIKHKSQKIMTNGNIRNTSQGGTKHRPFMWLKTDCSQD